MHKRILTHINMIAIGQQLPAILQRNSILLPRFLSYLLVVLIALSSAKLIWSLFSNDDSTQTTSGVMTAPPKLVKPPPPKPDYGSQIARLHLMGKASLASNNAIVDQNAPDTSLNLTLTGVLALGAGEGFAIIQNESKKHKFYHIDEEITSGVTLHSVFADYVLLSRLGRTEKLSLPKAAANGFTKVSNSSQRPANNLNRKPNTIPTTSNQEPTLSNLKQQLTKNPTSLAKYISISSANDEETGKFIGYSVKPNGNSSALFDELGLMENDVITSINGIVLDNPNKATQAFQKLVSATELQMSVLRSGTEIILLHNLE